MTIATLPKKRQEKRILRTIRLEEISGVDRSCQEGADVCILKRADPTPAERRAALLAKCDDTLADFLLLNLHLRKFNPHHDERGRFAEGPGGSGGGSSSAPSASTSGAADGAPAAPVTREHKDATLRWAQTTLRVAKIASWALVIPAHDCRLHGNGLNRRARRRVDEADRAPGSATQQGQEQRRSHPCHAVGDARRVAKTQDEGDHNDEKPKPRLLRV